MKKPRWHAQDYLTDLIQLSFNEFSLGFHVALLLRQLLSLPPWAFKQTALPGLP